MQDGSRLTRLTVQMVTAFLSNNFVPVNELPDLIRQVRETISNLSSDPNAGTSVAAAGKPAVPIKRSVTDAYIVCLEDGLKFKSLKRHLRSSYGMTPDEYRAKWGLPHDYPMVAPNYAEHRSQLAKQIGLGRQRAAKRR
jgi:predicted transcriptional regulator